MFLNPFCHNETPKPNRQVNVYFGDLENINTHEIWRWATMKRALGKRQVQKVGPTGSYPVRCWGYVQEIPRKSATNCTTSGHAAGHTPRSTV
jgi:hypothetical protein